MKIVGMEALALALVNLMLRSLMLKFTFFSQQDKDPKHTQKTKKKIK